MPSFIRDSTAKIPLARHSQKYTGLQSILIKDLFQRRYVLYCSKEEILQLKLTSAQISSTLLMTISEVWKWFFVYLFCLGCPKKQLPSRICRVLGNKKSFHFPMFVFSRYFFIQIFKDLLNEKRSIILSPPSLYLLIKTVSAGSLSNDSHKLTIILCVTLLLQFVRDHSVWEDFIIFDMAFYSWLFS